MPDQHPEALLALANPNDSAPEAPSVIQFNWPLFVHKRRFQNEQDYRYTIAIWRGTGLVSLCLMQPLEIAVQALTEILRNAGIPSSTTNSSLGGDGQ